MGILRNLWCVQGSCEVRMGWRDNKCRVKFSEIIPRSNLIVRICNHNNTIQNSTICDYHVMCMWCHKKTVTILYVNDVISQICHDMITNIWYDITNMARTMWTLYYQSPRESDSKTLWYCTCKIITKNCFVSLVIIIIIIYYLYTGLPDSANRCSDTGPCQTYNIVKI